MQAARDREGALREKESPAIDSATMESDQLSFSLEEGIQLLLRTAVRK